MSLAELSPTDDFDSHGFNFLFHGRVRENSRVMTAQKVASCDALQFCIVMAAVDDHLSHTGLQIAKRFQVPFLARSVVFAFIELEEIVNRRQAVAHLQSGLQFTTIAILLLSCPPGVLAVKRFLLLLSVLCCLNVRTDAADWPQFRGPGGQGHSDAKNLPLTWSETENITWKVPIAGLGWSSPSIQGNQIWLTTAIDEGKSLHAIAFDRASGRHCTTSKCSRWKTLAACIPRTVMPRRRH